VGIELIEQILEPGNVLGCTPMNDVEIFGRDGRAMKYSGGGADDDELDSGIHQSPEELSDVSVLWTWHLSGPGVKRRISMRRGADPVVKAKAPIG